MQISGNKKSYLFWQNYLWLILIIISVGFHNTSVYAQDVQEKFDLLGSGQVFKLNPITESILLVGGAGAVITSVVLEKSTTYPVYDRSVLNIDDVNPFDKWAMKEYSKTLDTVGTVAQIMGAASPLAVMIPLAFTQYGRNELFTVGVMYAEAALLEEMFKEIIKTSVSRTRPYSYFDGAPEKAIESGDWSRSFPSGHTSLSFMGAAFTSIVFCSYFPDSPWRWPVIAGSYAIAATTAALRMASGNHFFTDVLAGAALGTVIGLGVPLLHKIGLNPKEKLSKGRSIEMSISPVSFVAMLKM